MRKHKFIFFDSNDEFFFNGKMFEDFVKTKFKEGLFDIFIFQIVQRVKLNTFQFTVLLKYRYFKILSNNVMTMNSNWYFKYFDFFWGKYIYAVYCLWGIYCNYSLVDFNKHTVNIKQNGPKSNTRASEKRQSINWYINFDVHIGIQFVKSSFQASN